MSSYMLRFPSGKNAEVLAIYSGVTDLVSCNIKQSKRKRREGGKLACSKQRNQKRVRVAAQELRLAVDILLPRVPFPPSC